MEVQAFADQLEREGRGLAAAAEAAGPGAPVPTCPDWTIADLVQHLGHVHRWATALVSGVPKEEAEPGDARFDAPPGADLVPWYRESHAALVTAIRSAPADLDTWTFLPAPSPLAFWARRQAHETTVHRVDAESATGTRSPIPADFAADGVNEMVRAFAARPRRNMNIDPPVQIVLAATDTGDEWRLRLGPDRVVVLDDPIDADCEVRGPAADLYLLLWNRRTADGLDVAGDADALTTWRESIRVRWG